MAHRLVSSPGKGDDILMSGTENDIKPVRKHAQPSPNPIPPSMSSTSEKKKLRSRDREAQPLEKSLKPVKALHWASDLILAACNWPGARLLSTPVRLLVSRDGRQPSGVDAKARATGAKWRESEREAEPFQEIQDFQDNEYVRPNG
ncbi:hypothetical protein BDFG_01241 [Blastomyces dermatitidis ATCC 26199]|nr:hypothetical protein BDFG_01241 [Blastomyces dermatitidis ATCC 26199]